jgi:hypothetical protein
MDTSRVSIRISHQNVRCIVFLARGRSCIDARIVTIGVVLSRLLLEDTWWTGQRVSLKVRAVVPKSRPLKLIIEPTHRGEESARRRRGCRDALSLARVIIQGVGAR